MYMQGDVELIASRGRLRIVAVNNYSQVSMSMKAATKTPGRVRVKLTPLFQCLLSYANNGREHSLVTISHDNKDVSVVSGMSEYVMSPIWRGEFTQDMFRWRGEPQCIVSIHRLYECIDRTSDLAINQSGRGVGGVLCKIGERGMSAVATDGGRLAYVERDNIQAPDFECIIHPQCVDVMCDVLDLFSTTALILDVRIVNGYLVVRGNGLLMKLKLAGDEFIKYEQLMQHKYTQYVQTRTDRLIRAIRHCSSMGNDNVRLTFTPDALVVRSCHFSCCEFGAVAKAQIPCDSVDLGDYIYSAKHLIECLDRMSSFSDVILSVSGRINGLLKICEVKHPHDWYLIMPRRWG